MARLLLLRLMAFQSTRPGWGETANIRLAFGCLRISIHSPRVGRDYRRVMRNSVEADFNPLAPGGARHLTMRIFMLYTIFQSTRPGWGETRTSTPPPQQAQISIHSPRVGRDFFCSRYLSTRTIFQSTRPGWGETCLAFASAEARQYFNPLAPGGARHLREYFLNPPL